jgi:hypothetical protein
VAAAKPQTDEKRPKDETMEVVTRWIPTEY